MNFKLFLAVFVICAWSVDIGSIPHEKLHVSTPKKEDLVIRTTPKKSDLFGSTMNELLQDTGISNIMKPNSADEWSNPSSFINQLVKTDPKKVTPIIKLLKELIVHIQAELKSFSDGLTQAQQKLETAKATHDDAKAKFDSKTKEAKDAEEKMGSAKQLKDEAQTKYADAKTAYDVNKPVLLKHIDIVQSVIDKLGLLYSNSSKWELVVEVTNGRTTTSKQWWQGYCAKHGNVTVNSVMKLTMGDFVDYFKPSGSKTFCSFILGKTFKHSLTEFGSYTVPKTGYTFDNDIYGGSQTKQPDGRCHLSFWGNNSPGYAGCCASKKGQCVWHQHFKMELRK